MYKCRENRELSWLKFNDRVLMQAKDSKVPLGEKLSFISRYNMHGRTDYFERCEVKRIGRCGSRKRVRDSACSGERTSDRL